MTAGLTAVIFSYNRRDTIETVLRSVRFADRLIVFDKGSTDGTAEIGRAYADEFNDIPWSPTIDATKAEFVPKVDSEWLLVLDDDECLNLEAIAYVQVAMRRAEFDVHSLPLRHYVLGRHEEAAYYWPEFHPVLFRRGAMEYSASVHGPKICVSDRQVRVDPDTGVSVLHLSHPDARTWIEKTNRYTEELDRASAVGIADLTPDGVLHAMGAWLSKVPSGSDPYLTAIASLRGIYDIIDAIKLWEQQQPDRERPFASVCERLNQDFDMLGIPRREIPPDRG
jgi:glycosyltransferase involved in cell wall biosynthesis